MSSRSPAQQIRSYALGVCQGEEVAARHNVRLDAEAFAGHPALEVQGKEPVPLAGEYARRDAGPRREVAYRFEDCVCFRALMRLPFSGDFRGNVVQEVGVRVELGAVAVRLRRALLRGSPAGVVPPCARGFTRHGDHRIHQHELPDGSLFTHQRSGEAAQRLCHEHHVLVPTDGFQHQARVFGEPGALVVAGQINRKGLVAGTLQQGDDAAPVPGGAASARDQDERAHRSASQTPTAGPGSRSGRRTVCRFRVNAELIRPFLPPSGWNSGI